MIAILLIMRCYYNDIEISSYDLLSQNNGRMLGINTCGLMYFAKMADYSGDGNEIGKKKKTCSDCFLPAQKDCWKTQ